MPLTQNHNILLKIRMVYEVCGKALSKFTSVIENKLYNICGVPQGSALGPLRFICSGEGTNNSNTTVIFL